MDRLCNGNVGTMRGILVYLNKRKAPVYGRGVLWVGDRSTTAVLASIWRWLFEHQHRILVGVHVIGNVVGRAVGIISGFRHIIGRFIVTPMAERSDLPSVIRVPPAQWRVI